LFDDLCWAREVKKAFDNGIGEVIKTAIDLNARISKLPPVGIPGALVAETETVRLELAALISREDFFDNMPSMQGQSAELKTLVEKAAKKFLQNQTENLKDKKSRLQSLSEWNLLGAEDKARIGAELDSLKVQASMDINGIEKLLRDSYYFANELERIEKEIGTLAEPGDAGDEGEPGGDSVVGVTLDAPRMITSAESLNEFIQKLESLKTQLKEGLIIKITWR
jgi:hypothetical protein